MLGRIAFTWGASSWHGWGVIGLNLMLYWDGVALSLAPDLAAELGPGDTRHMRLMERLQQSIGVQGALVQAPWGKPEPPVWVALGNDFQMPAVPWQVDYADMVAFPVFEDLAMAERNAERLKAYPTVIAASRWNHGFLQSHGIPALLCHQGYDPVLFHPGVRRERRDGRFRVFSGGKCEWRKGQDLVLQAFARFAAKHDDAVLVAAWGSPWPGLSKSFSEHGIAPPPGAEFGMPNFRAWAMLHGIKPHQIEIVAPRPNWRMAEVYGGVDCALFPNRAEGGTNIVAMEAMGCGVPCFVRDEAGQRDLPGTRFCIDDADVVDGMNDYLEVVYDGKSRVVELDAEWSWPTQLAELWRILSKV
jgi:glycosyltransferase involved in cell wall biosynthesis